VSEAQLGEPRIEPVLPSVRVEPIFGGVTHVLVFLNTGVRDGLSMSVMRS